jgi:hypothetical protein
MNLEIIVANRHRMSDVENAAVVYVGRGTPLGNRATHEARWLKPGMVLAESREAAVEWFRRDLWQKMQDDTVELRELTRLAAIARERKLVLQCSCAPLRCHAEVVKRAVEYLLHHPPERDAGRAPGLKVIAADSARGQRSPVAQSLMRSATAQSRRPSTTRKGQDLTAA